MIGAKNHVSNVNRNPADFLKGIKSHHLFFTTEELFCALFTNKRANY